MNFWLTLLIGWILGILSLVGFALLACWWDTRCESVKRLAKD